MIWIQKKINKENGLMRQLVKMRTVKGFKKPCPALRRCTKKFSGLGQSAEEHPSKSFET